MPASLANNRSVARQVTLTAIALVALVLVLVGLATAVLTERSTRAQVVASVGDTAQSVAQSLDAVDNTNRELGQLAYDAHVARIRDADQQDRDSRHRGGHDEVSAPRIGDDR